jgi:steroid delta-isomerase-like uncharacterized protein
MATSKQDPATLARRMFDLLNARDLDGVGELQHEDVVDDFVAVGEFRGRPAVRKFFEDLFAAFPDFRLEIERITATDVAAVVQWHAVGTFTGTPFQGLSATGARVELRGVDCMAFEDGRLRHNTIYYDGAGFARAVGVLPAQRSFGERALFSAFNAFTAAKKALRG